MTFQDKLKDAMLLLLNKAILEYFGILSYSLKKETISKEEADQITGGVPIGGFTDGKRIVYLDSPGTSTSDVVLVTIHEILHVLSHHIQRADTRIPEIYQSASDHVVNRVCIEISKKTNSFKVPDGLIFFNDIEIEYPEISVEDLYELLLDRFNVKEINIPGLSRSGAAPGKTGKNEKDSGRYEYKKIKIGENGGYVVEITDKKTGKKMRGFMDSDPSHLPHNEDGSKVDPKELNSDLSELEEKAKTTWNSNVINKGELPGNVISYLNEILKIEIPWDILLETAVRYPVQSFSKRTWSWPDIYLRKLKIPGKKNRKNNLFTLIASLDTSGSVSNEDIKRFLGVLLGSVVYFKKMILIMHDHIVQDVLLLNNMTNEEYIIEQISKVKGRGGTSHVGPFTKIEEIVEEENVSSIVFLTDFESDVNEIYKKYNWVKEYPMIWVLNRDHPVNLSNCDVQVIKI